MVSLSASSTEFASLKILIQGVVMKVKKKILLYKSVSSEMHSTNFGFHGFDLSQLLIYV